MVLGAGAAIHGRPLFAPSLALTFQAACGVRARSCAPRRSGTRCHWHRV